MRVGRVLVTLVSALGATLLAPQSAFAQERPLTTATTPRATNTAPRREAAPLKFSHACDDGDTMIISAVGDFLFHESLQKQAARDPHHFLPLWQDALPLFQLADVRYGNLEGPVSPGTSRSGGAARDPGLVYDDNVYSGYPMFNYPREVTDDLAASGMTIVSTANNHAMDRSSRGVDLTIENLDRVGVKYVGTRKSTDAAKWYEVVESRGIRTAWIACAFSTNGIPDRQKQVLGCYTDTQELLTLINTLSKSYDAVIVTPHWGEEYHLQPIASQVDLGRKMMEAGALAVIGGHPHVLEPWTKYTTADGKEHFLIYSMGNFVSGQVGAQQQTSALLYLVLGRNARSGTFVRGVGYVPLRMEMTGHGWNLRPLTQVGDQAPNESWSTWYGHFGRANRVLAGETDLAAKFCALQ